jgi:hypothetical protein
MSKNRSIFLRGVSRRNAPPTELGESSGGGPPRLLLALAVLFAIGVIWYFLNPLDDIPQVAD